MHEKDALWAMKRAAGVRMLPEPARVSGKGIHLPTPSWWPLFTSIGILTFMVGIMVKGQTHGFPFGKLSALGFADRRVLDLQVVVRAGRPPYDSHASLRKRAR